MIKVIEIIGVAGAGKSTLTKRLSENFPDWEVCFRLPRFKTLFYQLQAVTRNILPLLLYSEKKTLFNNIKIIAHIYSTARYLSINKSYADKVIVFDQGVIFEYASLCNVGLCNAPKEYLKTINDGYMRKYFESIDVAVFLTAPDEVLYERVINRKINHRLKNFNEEETKDFFNGYNQVFNETKSNLKKIDKKVIEISTYLKHPNDVFDELIRSFKF